MLNEQKHEDFRGGRDQLCVEQPVVMLINVQPIQRAVFISLISLNVMFVLHNSVWLIF
jgi:hypothetical protein